MPNAESLKDKARAENNERLWEVLEAYKNDSEGLNRYQLTDLAEFNMAEGAPQSQIFDRAMKVCRHRADKNGMFIPRATLSKKNGYIYFLTDRPSLVVDGYIASEHVTAGMQKATYRHQKFIQKDTSDLSPMERVLFAQVSRISDERHQERENHLQEQLDQLEETRLAWREEQEQKEQVGVNSPQ